MNTASFLVLSSEPPVVVVVTRRSGTCKFVSLHSCVIDVRNVVVSNLVSIAQKHVHSIVVLQEFAYSQCKRIGISFGVVDPVICIEKVVLRGLSSPWMLKMSWLKP